MKLYLEDPKSKQRYSLKPSSENEPPGWIQENGTYHVVYEGSSDQGEPVLAISGLPLRRFERDGGQTVILKWEWTPEFYAGRVNLALSPPNAPPIVDTIILNPSEDKLTRERFDLMVSEILEQAETCFKLSPVSRQVSLATSTADRALAHFEFARRYFKELSGLLERLILAPHKHLERLPQLLPSGIATPYDVSNEWIAAEGIGHLRRAGSGWSLPGRARGYSLSDLQVSRSYISFDTYENRFVLHFLRTLQQRLVEALRSIRRSGDRLLARVRAAEASYYIQEIELWLKSPLFQFVGEYRDTQRGSHVLLKHPVYSRIHQIWSRFRRIPDAFDDNLIEMPLEMTWQLYEYWCYMMVVRCVDELGLIEDASGLFRVQENPGKVALALVQGEESRVRLKGGHLLYFHRRYKVVDQGIGTRTVEMEPDIALEFFRDGELQRIIVLDPKYRASPRSISDAITALHAYSHGICRFPDRTELVTMGIILAPTDGHPIFQPGFGDQAGIEGIQLVPGNKSTLKTLKDRLSKLLQPV